MSITSISIGLLLALVVMVFLVHLMKKAHEHQRILLNRVAANIGTVHGSGLRQNYHFWSEKEFQFALAAGLLVALAGVISSNIINMLFLGILTTLFIWWFLRERKLHRMRKDFEKAFPESVENFTRAIKAGVPLERAILATADNFTGEVGQRFRSLYTDLKLGLSFEEALSRFAEGLNNPDVDFFCQTLMLSRETGSPLSPILTTFCELMRERRRLDMRLSALTAESRASARILCLIPFFILGLQAFLNPSQLKSLFYHPTGQMVILYAVVSILTGFVIITKMTRSLES